MGARIFYSNIKVLRKKSNLSPAKFSQLINEPDYQNLEEGKVNPQIDKIIDIAYLHSISLDELLTQSISERKKSNDLKEILRKKIINEICEYFGIKLFEIKIKKMGVRKISECRQLIYYFLYENKLGSIVQIANDLGRGHSSVGHGIQVVKNLKDIDPEFRNNFNNLSERVKEIIDRNVK